MSKSEALQQAESLVDEIADLEEYYFSADKTAKMKEKSGKVWQLVEAFVAESGPDRAKASYIKGKLCLFVPHDGCDSQDLLSKAIKLDPTLAGAWNALGEVYWGKQDFVQCRQCFEQALELCGPNVASLRNLSMVLRAMDAEDKAENFTLSVTKAKEAVALDAADAQSWETLGNAYLGNFFINAGSRADDLSKALIAYDKAEAAAQKSGKINPSIYTNRGTVLKFLQNYDMAIESFLKAKEINTADASSEAEAKKLIDLVKKINELVSSQCRLKPKRLTTMCDAISVSPGSQGISQLKGGVNTDATLDAKIVQFVDRQNEVPIIAICVDSQGKFFALSIYNADSKVISDAMIPMDTGFSVKAPHLRTISVTRGEQTWSFPCIRIAHPGDINVFGQGGLGHAAVGAVSSFKKAARPN
jgi:tetratricopeptide (TPR) repeat protein